MDVQLFTLAARAVVATSLAQDAEEAGDAIDCTHAGERCLAHGVPGFGALVGAVAVDLWRDLAGSGVPGETLEADIADAAAVAQGQAIACDVAAESNKAEWVWNAALRAAGAHRRAALACREGIVSALASPTSDETGAGTPPSTNAVAITSGRRALAVVARDIALCTGLSAVLVQALVAIRHRDGAEDRAIAAELDLDAARAIETLSEIAALQDIVSDSEDFEALSLEALAQARAGAFEDAQLSLERLAEMIGCENDDTADNRCASWRVAVAATIAAVARLRREFSDAAHWYRRAHTHCDPSNRLRRWHLRLAEARVTAQIGRATGDVERLGDAAQLYAAAGGHVSEADAPVDWAESNLELGELLLELGDMESRQDRYLAAALHCKPALDVFATHRVLDGWSRAQLSLAWALRGQAIFQGDPTVLKDATFAFRAALGVITRQDGAPWLEARAGLGDTLCRLADETGDIASMRESIDILLAMTDEPEEEVGPRVRSLACVALARALAFIATEAGGGGQEAGDIGLLGDAVRFLSEATEGSDPCLTRLEEAQALRALGDTAARLAAIETDADLTARAKAAKEQAMALLRTLGADVEADEIARDLDAGQAAAGIAA